MTDMTSSGVSKGRLETLSDGVFAIVMTVLVLELIDSNVLRTTTSEALNHTLLLLWPKVLSYLISFFVLGVFWVGYHTEFRYITHTDSRHIWINILFLLSITFLPFSAALLGEHYQYQTAVVIYGLNRVVASLALYFNWWYATRQHRLVAADLDPRIVAYIEKRLLFGAASYLGAIGISFWSPTLSFLVYVLVDGVTILLQLLPSVVDQGRIRHEQKNAAASSGAQ